MSNGISEIRMRGLEMQWTGLFSRRGAVRCSLERSGNAEPGRLWDGGSGLVIAKYVTAFHKPAEFQQFDPHGTHCVRASNTTSRPDFVATACNLDEAHFAFLGDEMDSKIA
jgi:hypothetical protein